VTAEHGWGDPERFSPRSGVIDLWCFSLAERGEDRPRLSTDELVRAEKLIIEKKRSQFVAGRSLLREILALYLDCEPRTVRFEYGVHGKPRVAGAPRLSFNLSHSHELGLLGVTEDVRIGVDVEHRRPGRAFEAIAERFFADDEIETLLAAQAARRPQMFYRAWAQKEAYLKAWGTGLTFSSRGFSVTLAERLPPAVVHTSMPNDDPSRWSFADLDVPGDYAAAACWENPPRPIRRFRAR